MAISDVWHRPRFDLSTAELSGALGDSITVLPLVVAIGALSELSIGLVLLGFAVFQVVWGLYYRAPVSVEPMKALAALLIAGGMTSREFLVAGLLAGGVLLLVGHTGTLSRVQSYIGEPVVRGVQFAVALILLETGLRLGLGDLSIAVGTTVLVGALVWLGIRRAAPLLVLGVGAAIAMWHVGPPSLTVPALSSPLFTGESLALATVVGASVGQLAMTVGNAAVATSLLLTEYFDADVTPDDLASSMGVMNLLAVPLGMLPMCHGSGGVAGKYTFGARTAGSNLILGGLYGVVALFATGVVMAFPLSMLGVLLGVIALQLARTGLDSEHLGITVLVGVLSVLTNVGVGFVGGLLVYHTLERSHWSLHGRSTPFPFS